MRKVIGLLLSAAYIMVTPAYSGPAEENASRIDTINIEIELLEADMHILRSRAMELKLESYHLMITDWEEYSETMRKVEGYYDLADRIEQRINELNREKATLTKRVITK